jgi:RNA polymerase sigma factor (sigma-70 family)
VKRKHLWFFLRQLERDNFEPRCQELGRTGQTPTLGTLWDEAWDLRDRLGLVEVLSVEALLALFWPALDYCLRKFDPGRGDSPQLPVEKRFKTYFAYVLRGRVLDQLGLTLRHAQIRRRRRKRALMQYVGPARGQTARLGLEHAAEGKWRESLQKLDLLDQRLVNEAVQALPAEERRLVRLLFEDDESLQAAGAVLGLSRHAAQRRRDRAYKRLRGRLARLAA